jgi:hypothetical protein
MVIESSPADTPTLALPKSSRGFFGYVRSHWRGELSLPQSYWVNGVLIGAPIRIYFAILTVADASNALQSPRTWFEVVLAPFALSVLIAIWQVVGIWRSAGRRMKEGRIGWAVVARIVIVINAIFLIVNVAKYAQFAYSISLAYVDQQHEPYSASVANGIVSFSGMITPAGADRLETLIDSRGVNRLVMVQSRGGYVAPTLRLAQIVLDKNLTVVVTRQCASGCTAILAAGKRRFITPWAVIGLHTGVMVGTSDVAIGWSKVEDLYKGAGVGADLMNKIRAHRGPHDLYEPPVAELIDNGLATDVYNTKLKLYEPAKQWCAEFPRECSRTGRENLAAIK